MNKPLLSFATLAVLALAAPAQAHISITNPPMRFEYDPVTQKTGPCGGGIATGIVTPLQGGTALTMTWDETVPHPGHFRIALDADENGSDDFSVPADENDMVVQGNIVAYVPDNGGDSFEHTFVLPNVDCEPCVIQLLQIMTDKLGDGFTDGGDIYHWCADITLTSMEGAGGGNPVTTTGTGAGGGQGGAGEGGAGEGGSTGSGNDGGPAFGFPEEKSGCSTAGAPARSAPLWLVAALALRTIRSRSGRRRSPPTRAGRG